jgi:hypothetical protein
MEPTPVRPGGPERVEGAGRRQRDGRTPGQRRERTRPAPAAQEPEPAEEVDIGPEPSHEGRLDIVV